MESTINKYSKQLIIFNSIFIFCWLVLSIFPFLWTFWGSFKVKADFFSRADWWHAISGINTLIETGGRATLEAYINSWIEGEFWRAARNTIIVTVSVVTISLFLGTLGAYALSRSTYKYAFWILIAALFFRAMPHITLVSGYLFPFFQLKIWGILPTSIIVLVAINQPFTLWLLYSFFKTVPKDLDESALIDGASYFQVFRYIIMPVMWPGVITAGLFSLMLAYNDFTVTALLLNQENYTMVPKINAYLGTVEHGGNYMWAVASVVSATAPLFMIVMFFQRQLISGMTTGAVKG
ncbi:MAG: carbohydrate ABC transporter permease [Candidatus Marinimicrobia bacterium]|jgi:ABC-type glycerol-3-phosphate transport system permease component|nr:carbohydrate ABC transporter permease [Candidatus Neomarinimicrobiota bacterium]